MILVDHKCSVITEKKDNLWGNDLDQDKSSESRNFAEDEQFNIFSDYILHKSEPAHFFEK